MIQLFMSRSGSSVIVPLRFPASQSAITEASCQLDEASIEGKTEIVEIKSVIANLPSYLGGLDPDSRTKSARKHHCQNGLPRTKYLCRRLGWQQHQ